MNVRATMRERRGRRSTRRRDRSPRPLGAAVIVVGLLLLVEAFVQRNPFASPFQLHLVFTHVSSLNDRSPVRIAGIDVGSVAGIRPRPGGSGNVEVTIDVSSSGLPIHRDAIFTIRPRLLLEGYDFLDINPGSPSTPDLRSGETVPVVQTVAPVNFDQTLSVLQSGVRRDAQIFFREYGENALGHGGADAYRRSLPAQVAAERNTSLFNEGSLGLAGDDVSDTERATDVIAAELGGNTRALQTLVVDLDRTATALNRPAGALSQSVPAFARLYSQGPPAFTAINRSIPPSEAYARAALPGIRSTAASLDAQLPFLRQLRALAGPSEIGGLASDLRTDLPILSVNTAELPRTLELLRRLASCDTQVLTPWLHTAIPDPDFPADSGQPVYMQLARSLVGVGGESRTSDANGPFARYLAAVGPYAEVAFGPAGEKFFSMSAFPTLGTRPAMPAHQPQFRPDVPCESQQPPSLDAPKGAAEQAAALQPTVTAADARRTAAGNAALQRIADQLRTKPNSSGTNLLGDLRLPRILKTAKGLP